MRVIFTYISLLLSSILYSQDSLVLYSGFEENFQPVYNANQIADFNSIWFTAWGTPDMFSTNSIGTGRSIPINVAGHQIPLQGESYSGLATFANYSPLVREWLGTKLTDSLIEGQTYCIKMNISLADTVSYASDNFGVYFNPNSMFQTNSIDISYPLNYEYVISTPHGSIFNNSEVWTKIELQYTAKGDERYMYIGNFYPDSLTTFQYTGVGDPQFGIAYYYIDEVSVYKCEGVSIKENTVSPITIYPNPSNGIFTIESGNPIQQLKIYNAFGQLVQTESPNSVKTTVDLTHLQAGIYLCNIDNSIIKLIKE